MDNFSSLQDGRQDAESDLVDFFRDSGQGREVDRHSEVVYLKWGEALRGVDAAVNRLDKPRFKDFEEVERVMEVNKVKDRGGWSRWEVGVYF